MLSRQECVTASDPVTMATAESADTGNVVHEVTVKLDDGKSPEAWAGLKPPGQVRALDALHHMLQEASVLSSHLRAYKPAVESYTSAAGHFFDAMRDFMASSGDPALYENALTPDGIKAAQAATAATAAAETGQLSPEASAAAGVHAAQGMESPVSSTVSSGSTDSAFAADAAVPKLPLLGAAGVSKSGLVLCPGVPNTAAMGVKGGLTKVVPAALHLPAQHAALFSTEQQRNLVNHGSDALSEVLRCKLIPTIQLWLDTHEECKVMLPQVERLRITADKARGQLDAAMGAVVTAEASNPMVDPDALTSAGVVVPHVLVRGSEGTVLTHETAGGATDAAGAVAAAGGAGGASQLVAVPALKEREAMYKAEQAETDATLSFELAEKVLRDRLRWLVASGAGLKALLTSALAHSLRAAADMGEEGHAAGGTTAGQLRAPMEELLTPFPQHVLARLKGEHLPTLPDLVLADQSRLARWCERYKAAMSSEAAASAAAAGAQMLAAAAAGPGTGGTPSEVGPAGHDALTRTDEGAQGGAAAGTAAVLAQGGKAGRTGTVRTAAAPAGPDTDTAGFDQQAGGQAQGAVSGMGVRLERVAAESGLPLDLLAAAVAADVQEQEAAAAKASKGDLAWRLLHDASITVGKEQAVLLPEVKKAVQGVVPSLLIDSHARITDALSQLSRADLSSPVLDLAVLEVVEVLEQHTKVLKTEVLPALSDSDSRLALQSLAGAYRRAAATAPTRPHAWLLNKDTGNGTSTGGRASRWVSSAVGAAGRMAKAPMRVGAALADAAADAAHFGARQAPLKA